MTCNALPHHSVIIRKIGNISFFLQKRKNDLKIY